MSEIVSTPEPTNPHPPAVLTPTAEPRTRSGLMRTAGNLLIIVGVLLLVSVGGYLGIQSYQNNKEANEIRSGSLNLPPPALPPQAPPSSPTPGNTSLPGANPPAPTATIQSSTVLVSAGSLPNLSGGLSGNTAAPAQPSSPPVRLDIPSIQIDVPVVPVGWDMIPGKGGQDSAQWQVAENAVGHHQGTANPGEIGNVVMSGHVDWKGEVFRNLHKIERGAEIRVYTGDREYLYIVQDKVLVKEEGPDVTDDQRRSNAAYMNPTPDQTLTLITCWPYGVDDHRLIVIAKPYDSGLPSRPDLVLK